MLGLPAMALSLDCFRDPDFRPAASFARRLAAQVLKRGLAPSTLLNVNVPHRAASRIRGVKVTRQGSFRFEDKFVKRRDPHGRDYYWLTGARKVHSRGADCDDRALKQGFISVTPIGYSMTDQSQVAGLKEWDFS